MTRKIMLFLFPAVLFSVFLGIKIASPKTYADLVQEDSVIEYAQALGYFSAAIFAALTAANLFRGNLSGHGLLYGLLSLGLLLVALEEISWGQRLLKITTPDYLIRHNLQNEISLHNLDSVQPLLHYAYILTGAYGAFAWLAVKIFLPKPQTKGWRIINFVVPDWFLSPFFFSVFFIYILLSFVSPSSKGFFQWRDQEPMELLLAMGFLFFTAQNFRKSHKKPEQPA